MLSILQKLSLILFLINEHQILEEGPRVLWLRGVGVIIGQGATRSVWGSAVPDPVLPVCSPARGEAGVQGSYR